jgi:hypothetical protein
MGDSMSIRGKNPTVSLPDGRLGIVLAKGLLCIIDANDYPRVAEYHWCPVKSQRDKTYYCSGYLIGTTSTLGRKPIHRLITDAPDDKLVDHRDGEGLHNWQSNLRVCLKAQNNANRRISKNNSVGYKGVRRKKDGSFLAEITHAKRTVRLGSFSTAEDAARAWDAAAVSLWGEFAITNFPIIRAA